MDAQAELESLRTRIAKAPTNAPRIMPNTRKMLFAVLGDADILKGDRADRVQVWRLVTGRDNIGSTNDLTDSEARLFIEWLTNPNTGQPRYEAVAAVRSLLTGAGGEGQMELTESEGENVEQQKETKQQAEPRQHWTEAPVSFNLKAVSPQGFDCMLTLRGDDGAGVMNRAFEAMDWLIERGFQPTNGYSAPPKATSDSPPTLEDGTVDPAWCTIHNVTMKRREKDGQVWYSHKAGDEWCRGKE